MMAKPGELSYCRLSVMTSATFDVQPLPPYFEPSVKHSIESTKSISKSKSKSSPKDPITTFPPTQTYPFDFYPPPYGKVNSSGPLPRPILQGIMLTPKLDGTIKPKQKEAWDFVLRKSFARSNTTVLDTLKNLAFGGGNLVRKIEGKELDENGVKFAGVDVGAKKRVRELHVNEWERIVDVFDRWAFRPEVSVGYKGQGKRRDD